MTLPDTPATWREPAEKIAGQFNSLACLADVHGNTAALEAVLASPQFAPVDAVAFLGCTTTGPDPQGVLQLCGLIDKPALFIAGNGERAVLQTADGDLAEDWPTGRWLAQRHGPAGLAKIREWPASIACVVGDLGLVRLCHGSPRSDTELLTPHTSAPRITEATAGIVEPTIVHGHTHLQYDRHVAGMRVIGAGSVGLPYTNGPFGARWAVLGPDVRLISTAYDLDVADQRITATGYPDQRYLQQLRNPPTPQEIIADAESRHFSD